MTNALGAGLWGLLAFGLGAAAMRFMMRFFVNDHGGDQRKRFLDNVVGMAFLSAAIACFLMAVVYYDQGSRALALFPFALCLVGMVFPIGIVGSYWRSFQSDRLFGKYKDVMNGVKPDSLSGVIEADKSLSIPGPGTRIGLAVIGWFIGASALFGILYWRPESSLVCALGLVALVGFFGPVLWIWVLRQRKYQS